MWIWRIMFLNYFSADARNEKTTYDDQKAVVKNIFY